METITPREFAARQAAGEGFVVVDVREPDELCICRIAGSLAIPLGELAQRWGELDPQRATVLVCHHGVRSAQAARFLDRQDFVRTLNLAGGIDRWARELEPGMARY